MTKHDLLSRAIPLSQLAGSSTHFVVNQGFGAYLKLGFDTDSYNDRYAYAHEGNRDGDERYAWVITPLGGDMYSFQNASNTGGFLFEGDQADGDGDHRIRGHNTSNIVGSKGDRYKFKVLPVDGGGNIYHIQTVSGDIMKAGYSRDDDGDYGVYGQPKNDDGDRYQWIIVPVP
ncbi:hypothetical protein P7L78_02785 (plasmid) [Tistrella bauzanensis]|jgi:hypothetical protein|uniref:Ricin B lectin domain-containing protein n=1 Tax=Tistrella arctica TaxID=3133430 RepID=A0ABU9YRK1_9PROT